MQAVSAWCERKYHIWTENNFYDIAYNASLFTWVLIWYITKRSRMDVEIIWWIIKIFTLWPDLICYQFWIKKRFLSWTWVWTSVRIQTFVKVINPKICHTVCTYFPNSSLQQFQCVFRPEYIAVWFILYEKHSKEWNLSSALISSQLSAWL